MAKKAVNRSKRKGKRLVAVIAVFLCAAMIVEAFYVGGRINKYEAREEALNKQIEEQIQESERLQEESEFVGTLEYIEKIAREKLGMVKDDEIILKKEE